MQAAVEVPCPHCFRGLGVPPEAFGRMLACPHCGGTLTFAGPQGESHGSGRTIVAVIGGGLLLLIGLAAVVSLRMPPEVAQPPREAVEAETEPPEAGVPRRTDRPHRIAEPPQPEENETEPTAPPSREPPVAEPPSREPPSAVPFDPGPPDGGPTDWRKRSPLRLTSNVGGSVVALAEAAGEGSRVGLWSTNGGGRAGRSVVLPFRPERLILAPEGRRVAASGRLRQDHVLWCWDASDPAPPRTAVVDANCIPSHWHFTPDAARLVGAVGPGENSPAQPEIPRKRRIEWNLAANRLECPRATPDGSVSDGPCFFLPGRLPATVSVSEPWFSDTTTLRISAAGGKVEIPAARGDIEVFAGTSPQAGRSNLVVGVGAQGMAIDRTDGRILLRLDPEGAEPTPMQAGLDEVQFSPDARRAIWWARRPETAAGIDRPARSVLIRFDVEKQRGYFLPGHFLGAAYLADGTLVVADRPPEAAAPRLRFPADAEFVPMPFAPADPLANAVIRPVVAKEAPWPDHAVTASLEGFFGNEDLTVLTPDGRRAVCITRGREKNRWTLQVMDVADGREALRLDILPPEIEDAKPPRELVHSDLTVSPDGRRVLFSEPEYRAGNLTGRICAAIVDVEHATLRRLPVQDTVRNRFLGFSADGSKVLCRREGLDLIDLAAGTAEPVPTEFETGLIDGLSFWPDGRVVRRFPSGRLRFFRSWEALMAGTTEFDTKFIASDHQANMLRPVDGGRTVWTNLGYPSNRLVRWDLAGNRPPEVFDLSSVSADITRLSTVKASPDGRFAAFGPPCQLLDAETATLILVRSHPIGWAADGSLAVDWRTAGTEFYDPVAGKWLAKLPRPQGQ